MHLHYRVKRKDSCFVKILIWKSEKQKITYLRQLLSGSIEINISYHKLAQHCFSMLAELNKYG